nr:HEAT repeat domain-containing protein [Halorubellus salinus]
METAEQRDSTISPDESISLADDTASTGSTSGRDDPPTSSTAGEPDTTPDPGTSRAQSRDAGRATDDTTTASPSGSGNATRSNKSEPAGRTSASGSETTTDLDETAAASDAAESSTNPDDVTASSTGADDAVASSGSESDAIADVREDLTAETPATRQEAVQELAHRAQAADVPEQSVVDALSARLDDGDPSVRAEACDALGSLGASAAKPALKERRIDSDPEVSRAASRAIRNLE